MAGSFTNASQSRFLSNSQNASNTASNGAASSPGGLPRPRSRVLSTRQFSTSSAGGGESTSSSGDEKAAKKVSKEKLVLSSGPRLSLSGAGVGGIGGLVPRHPLHHTWVFWFRQHRAPGNKIVNYEEGIKKISTFGSIESFWSLWTHLNPPSLLVPTTDLILFHSEVKRPVWEDSLNVNGGKWIIRLKKGIADRIWEDIVMAVVGDQFDDCAAEDGVDGDSKSSSTYPEICGCTLSVRQSEDILSIWNKDGSDGRVRQNIRDTIRKILDLPQATVMEYKTNNDSLQDRSSFRNSQVDRLS
ncbi:eukaryotic translation initiation factor 4E [Schizopora paradoxa]|uniref:Eukaryotic translation initiation factor 4E n=1 Tax=Schizopora paradoxa TaxID=27342 RepID=A0A0H2S584_9AGAM|nr:eukaryotic translation initiation factor 4E [Schizopora paradoxa]